MVPENTKQNHIIRKRRTYAGRQYVITVCYLTQQVIIINLVKANIRGKVTLLRRLKVSERVSIRKLKYPTPCVMTGMHKLYRQRNKEAFTRPGNRNSFLSLGGGNVPSEDQKILCFRMILL